MNVKPYPLKAKDKNGREYCPGYVIGNVFKKTPAHKDLLGSPPGWTIGLEIFKDLPRFGITVIQMYDKDERKLYVTSYKTFKENCLIVNRKNGDNAVLALPFWHIVPNG